MNEAIRDFYDAQFQSWPEAKENYAKLSQVRRRTFPLGDLTIYVQCNPARVRSTAADVSARAVSERPCFLCEKNRPEQQLSGKAIPDYDILINPYPILPVHFTIASREHIPQSAMPLEMVDFVTMMPLCTAFFNGAKAGASAPDHLHFQAVMKEELPLLSIVEERHKPDMPYAVPSAHLGHFPMGFISCIIPQDLTGMQLMATAPYLCGVHDDMEMRRGLVNTFYWLDAQGNLRLLIFPRKAHRPEAYFREDDLRLMISPGALDMAGLIVTPDESTFERITAADITDIYEQVGVTQQETLAYCQDEILQSFTKNR